MSNDHAARSTLPPNTARTSNDMSERTARSMRSTTTHSGGKMAPVAAGTLQRRHKTSVPTKNGMMFRPMFHHNVEHARAGGNVPSLDVSVTQQAQMDDDVLSGGLTGNTGGLGRTHLTIVSKWHGKRAGNVRSQRRNIR